MKIILLGYMACGKSIVGQYLAKALNIPFYDLDDLIVLHNKNISIKNIFLYKGELYFRDLERYVMCDFFSKENKYVLSLGGGTPCYSNNMDFVNKQGVSIYLKSDIITLYNRLIKEKINRPIISSVPNTKMMHFIKHHLYNREIFYLRAHVCVTISHKKILDIVKEINNIICY
jgi:shikimate kinase